MIGIHLHDVRGLDDHLSPGQGEIHFEQVMPFMKSVPIKILEVHSKVERQALLEGVQFIKELIQASAKMEDTKANPG
jgi:sugar phosphate isomerase/epimerase